MKDTTNRCAIFVVYDKDGAIDDYIFFLLDELKSVANHVIVVINGQVNIEDYRSIEKKADYLYERENIGCDAGAYQDTILNVLKGEIYAYDEVILCNDTFFGPFCTLQKIFDKMGEKYSDFWGISYIDAGVFSYIQAFFLVIKKSIIEKRDLQNYFSDKSCASFRVRNDSVVYFERGLFRYLNDKGYLYDAFIKKPQFYCYNSSTNSIVQDRLPILKKKAFAPAFYHVATIMSTLKYLYSNGLYDIEMIINHVNRIYGLNIQKEMVIEFKYNIDTTGRVKLGKPIVSMNEILEFIEENESYYIYGVGSYGTYLFELIKNKLEGIQGFIVSDGKRETLINEEYIQKEWGESKAILTFKGHRIYEISEIKERENAGVIVALDFQNTKNISGNLKKFKETLYLWEI